ARPSPSSTPRTAKRGRTGSILDMVTPWLVRADGRPKERAGIECSAGAAGPSREKGRGTPIQGDAAGIYWTTCVPPRYKNSRRGCPSDPGHVGFRAGRPQEDSAMARKGVWIALIALMGLFLAAPAARAEEPAITGTYDCEGDNGDGTTYKGKVTIS